MICVSIIEKTTAAAITAMHEAAHCADAVEVRVDHIRDPDIAALVAASPVPLIVTVTMAAENGHFSGSEQERTALLRQAIACGADYIDVSCASADRDELIRTRGRTKVILSYHNYTETPPGIADTYAELKSCGANIVKIATFANRLSDNRRILDLLEQRDGDTIGICMGEHGQISRVLGPLCGSYLTFACARAGSEAAPGQIPAEVLRTIYRVQDLRPGFSLYGLVGNPVSKSRGYLLFNALFRHYGMNSLYLNFPAQDLDDFMESFGRRLDGFSITMPHKQAVSDYLDETDLQARSIGAVNTVVRTGRRLKGFNTDLNGIMTPLGRIVDIRGKRVTLLGAGGAARAAAAGITAAGGRLTILNRTAEKARTLAAAFGCSWAGLDAFGQTPTDILLNMTAVGMHPDTAALPVPAHLLRDMVVFDGVYNPARTALIEAAAKNGCTVIPGTEMFLAQAARQFELWTGTAPESACMKDALGWN